MKSEAYLREIRETEGLSRAVLKKIVVEGETVTFYLVTDKTYRAEDAAHAKEVSVRYVPAGYKADVNIMKSVPSEEGVRRQIADTIKDRFPSAAAFLSPQDISVFLTESGGRFQIGVDEAERAQFDRANVLDELVATLNRTFCGAWYGDFCNVKKEKGEIETEIPPAETVSAPRAFKIANYEEIDGAKPTYAVYIADLSGEKEEVTVCGNITHIEERVTKTNKPFFSLSVADGSGTLRTSYFTRKTTLEKIRALKAGDSVCLTGSNELFNGSWSFRTRQIDYGTPPEGYEFVSRPSRPAPANYTAVFPEPVENYVQSGLFEDRSIPESFRKGKFVVFDLETTGLNSTPAGGAMDRIIEIGAVKIEDGSITEKFSSFIACPVKLSEEIKKLTGIDDEMLVGAPEVDVVMADFYKFSEGCALVGHNVQFDCGFIRYYGEQAGYLFQQRTYDTITLAQELLRLKNYKLNTVADYFGFTFNHHRAFDDAFVTANIFIELARMKGGL